MVSKDNDKVGGERSRPIQIGFSAESREIDQGLDINKLLVSSPSSTFFFRLSENIKGDLDLHCNDILVVDRAEQPANGAVVIFSSEEGFLIGRCGNSHYEVFRSSRGRQSYGVEREGLMIWGVVTGMVRHLSRE